MNVYAPSTPAPKDGRSVMFWIYGGSLQFGNAGQAAYDGSWFASYEDVIVVSANYRTNGKFVLRCSMGTFTDRCSLRLPLIARAAADWAQPWLSRSTLCFAVGAGEHRCIWWIAGQGHHRKPSSARLLDSGLPSTSSLVKAQGLSLSTPFSLPLTPVSHLLFVVRSLSPVNRATAWPLTPVPCRNGMLSALPWAAQAPTDQI